MKAEGSNGEIVLEAIVQAIPYVGGPLSTLYFGRKQEKRFRRLERFYTELKDEIASLHRNSETGIPDISKHNPHELSAILEQLNEKVESEHLESKRRLYKQYFKKTMMYPVNGNYDERKLFLDILAALTPLQIELVVFFSQQSGPVQGSSISKPGVEQALISGSVAQLKTYGLVQSALNSIVFGGAGNAIHESLALSDFGRRFHSFCCSEI